jgi:hypothetical protein
LSLHQAEKKHERDRIQWSDQFNIRFDVIARGLGEGLIEPVYFGAAYANPPLFEWSAAWAGETLIDLAAWGVEHPEVKALRAAGGSSVIQDQLAPDGSFEGQMLWNDPYIPKWDQSELWPQRYQKIEDDQSVAYNRATPWNNGTYTNWWVQEPLTNLWAITDERSHEHNVGPEGKYSAKVTLNSSGLSPWLVPIWGAEGGYFGPLPADQTHLLLKSYQMPIASGQCGSPTAPFENPDLLMHHELWVNSDSPCTVELDMLVYSVVWPNPTIRRTDTGDSVFWQSEWEDNREYELTGGDWEQVLYEIPPPSHLWPGIPYPRYDGDNWTPDPEYFQGLPDEDDFPAQGISIPARIMFRVKGQPGQEVFLDDALFYPRLVGSDAPLITVGVHEWIQDEGGAYVGAKLWVKIDTSAPLRTCFLFGKDT